MVDCVMDGNTDISIVGQIESVDQNKHLTSLVLSFVHSGIEF